MNDSIKISRKTKSKAYQFIKSLMKDGVEGDDIHNLVTAISDNVNPTVGGEILTDLIRNSKDENGDFEEFSHWFGPISNGYFHWITKSWADYCQDTELHGVFRFGDLDDWKEWNKQGGNQHSDEEVKKRADRSDPQLCIFEWKADAVTALDVKTHLNDLYKKIRKRVKNEQESDGSKRF